MNEVNLIGRLTKAIEINDFAEGKCVGRGSIAVRDGQDAEGNDRTQFISYVCWNQTADAMYKFTDKGSLVGLHGKLVQNVYEKDGVKHYSMDVLVDKAFFLESKKQEEPKEEVKEVKKTSRRASR